MIRKNPTESLQYTNNRVYEYEFIKTRGQQQDYMNKFNAIQLPSIRNYCSSEKTVKIKENYMSLLILCLVQKGYLFIRPNVTDSTPNVLFKVEQNNKYESKQFAHINFKGYINYGICYKIPAEIENEWNDVISFIVDDFRYKLECLKEENTFSDLWHLFLPETEWLLCILLIFAQNLQTEKRLGILQEHFKDIYYYLMNFEMKSHSKSDIRLKILNDLLQPEESATIFNPLGGVADYVISTGAHRTYVGNTTNKNSFYLGKLFLLTQEDISSFTWKIFSLNDTSDTYYDNIVLDLSVNVNINKKYFADIENKMIAYALERLSSNGKMAFFISNPSDYSTERKALIQDLVDNNWLDTIVCHETESLYLLVDKSRDFLSPIRQIYLRNEDDSLTIDDWEKQKKKFYHTNSEEIRDEEYNLIFYFAGKQVMQEYHPDGFKMLRIGCLLSELPYFNSGEATTPLSFLSAQILKEKTKTNYPFNPYIDAANGVTMENDDTYFQVAYKNCIVFPLFENLGSDEPVQPLLFNGNKGGSVIEGACYQIHSEKIDPEYLVMEMDKDYFQEQMELSDSGDRMQLYLRLPYLYIYVPEGPCTLEQQKQIVRKKRWQHVIHTAKNVGQDLSILTKMKDSYLAIGTQIGRREYGMKYTIKGYLGHGGFGRTYLALNNHPENNEPLKVAIKEFFVNGYQQRNPNNNEVIPLPGKDSELLEKACKKFYKEANIMKEFAQAPNIINVYDVFFENSTTYYTMEYMKFDLEKYCKLLSNNSHLEESYAVEIIKGVAEALKAMHSIKMNHLDVKPSNILIDNDGHARLIDFGTVKDFGNGNQTTTVNMASQGFSAPEVSNGTLKTFSPQADIYSLGKTLEYMLQGDEPLQEKSGFITEDPISNIPPQLDKLIKRCTSFYPEDRPKDIDEFLTLLEECNGERIYEANIE